MQAAAAAQQDDTGAGARAPTPGALSGSNRRHTAQQVAAHRNLVGVGVRGADVGGQHPEVGAARGHQLAQDGAHLGGLGGWVNGWVIGGGWVVGWVGQVQAVPHARALCICCQPQGICCQPQGGRAIASKAVTTESLQVMQPNCIGRRRTGHTIASCGKEAHLHGCLGHVHRQVVQLVQQAARAALQPRRRQRAPLAARPQQRVQHVPIGALGLQAVAEQHLEQGGHVGAGVHQLPAEGASWW